MALIRNDDSEMIYQRPMRMRWIMGAFGLLFLAMIGYLVPVMLPTGAYLHHRYPAEVIGCASGLVFLLGTLLPVGIFLYAAGPDELFLDVKTRCYRFRRGFPGLAQWQTGPFDDIACLYTKRYAAQNSVTYQMLLGWKGAAGDERFAIGDGDVSRRKDVLLGAGSSMEDALEQITPLAARLGVPVEDGLQPERQARNARSARRLQNRILPLFFGGMALMYLLMSVPDMLVTRMLDSRGRTTQGVVVARHGSHSTNIDFRYTVGGETYTTTNQVAGRETALDTGDTVPVTYLPDYPHTARIPQSNVKRQGGVYIGIAVLMLIVGVLMPIAALFKLTFRQNTYIQNAVRVNFEIRRSNLNEML